MKVAVVKAPAVQNQTRGVGVYGRELLAALVRMPGIEITEVPFDFWRWDYSEFDLVHFLYFDLFFLTFPPWRNRKTVVTVMDLTPIKLPNLYPPGIKGGIKWQIQKLLLGQVDQILTISKSAKVDIVEIVGVPGRKVTVTYLAAAGIFKLLKTKKENFVLYVGGANGNKNVITLVKACQRINAPLVIVGKEFIDQNANFSHVENQPLKEILDAAGMTDNVKLFGFVEKENLVKLYNQAKVYVQPSIYEGFGLPVLEAMAAGTPVVCGRNSSFPEVAGEAAVYADVTSSADLAAKIEAVLRASKSERKKIIDKGLKQAAKFSWTKTVQETIKAYEKVLAGL